MIKNAGQHTRAVSVPNNQPMRSRRGCCEIHHIWHAAGLHEDPDDPHRLLGDGFLGLFGGRAYVVCPGRPRLEDQSVDDCRPPASSSGEDVQSGRGCPGRGPSPSARPGRRTSARRIDEVSPRLPDRHGAPRSRQESIVPLVSASGRCTTSLAAAYLSRASSASHGAQAARSGVRGGPPDYGHTEGDCPLSSTSCPIAAEPRFQPNVRPNRPLAF